MRPCFYVSLPGLLALAACLGHAAHVGRDLPSARLDSRKEDGPAGPRGEVAAPEDEGARHPLAGVSDAELERRLIEDRASLGPVSLGQPDAGLLWNGVPMPEGEGWTVVHPERSWATPETVASIIAAIDKVRQSFPDSPRLSIGNISKKGGGKLGEHLSHRSGRDVDLGFYYADKVPWYTEATEENLDIPRTWALIRALVTETDVELILIDRSLHWPLRAYARSVGEDRAWVRSLFVKGPPPDERLPVQHRDGHKAHMHVRFWNPVAQTTGYRIYPLAVKHGLFTERRSFIEGWSKRGEPLEAFLRRYGTSKAAFVEANGPRARRFTPGRRYKILRYGPVDPGEGPPRFLPRMLPPAKSPPPE